jgi:hypothetical protein
MRVTTLIMLMFGLLSAQVQGAQTTSQYLAVGVAVHGKTSEAWFIDGTKNEIFRCGHTQVPGGKCHVGKLSNDTRPHQYIPIGIYDARPDQTSEAWLIDTTTEEVVRCGHRHVDTPPSKDVCHRGKIRD